MAFDYNLQPNNFGNFYTKTFLEVFPDYDTFANEWHNCELYDADLQDANLKILYYELYGRYANSTVASLNEDQFKYRLWSIIKNQGTIWQSLLDQQAKLRGMSEEDISTVRRFVTSHAFNPGEGGVTATDEAPEDVILNYVDDQTRNKEIASPIEALTVYSSAIADVTTRFIDSFKVLFLKIVRPYSPLYYRNEGDN